MKLLLVDAERYVIESIKKNICWERTGITEIYTAFTMKQAQEIITAVKMDIIISDIVIPAATGFDLVQWVREQNFRIQVIFLTSYAEFDYARRAIQLESVEYLLKPIDFEKLEEALKKAEQAVLQEKHIEKLTEASEQWEKDRTILQKDIWRNLLSGNMTQNQFCESGNVCSVRTVLPVPLLLHSKTTSYFPLSASFPISRCSIFNPYSRFFF